ncbi:DUF5683 domain-containing protein [Meridianimaribacter flavus]|uniref:DUF5683 domain-containing protein n=1 Tax=Meridianimaribacter flavus TaxID=571115 RepID=A0ABY2G423_9FLAO|nr:DUF5683 domain-containing protein [Meridianimaribacter flavus]TDY11521.1 hypothetical protein A8975_2160 [Meridianimaribacter flavus]
MPNKTFYSILFLLFIGSTCFSQSDSTKVDTDLMVVNDTITREPINILAPSKAAFYSAVLPGLGQAYNKKYWKIPIVVGAITTGILIYDHNNREYHRYRDAYKSRLAGYSNDEFWGTQADGTTPLASPRVSDDGLIRAQESLRRNKEISLLVTIGIYALNIIDANVDAHLLQYNVDENLALKPHFKYNELENTSDLGVTVNFKF